MCIGLKRYAEQYTIDDSPICQWFLCYHIFMKLILRFLRSVAIILIIALVAWLVLTQVYDRLDQRLPGFFAILATYLISAYVIFPKAVHAGTVLFRSGRIPRYSRTPDGLTADPVNIILFGTKKQLEDAFEKIGWHKADRLSAKSTWNMAQAFLRKKPYATAPFSPLYLFGKIQDIGFQEPIGNSPRQRHHVRFWAAQSKPQTSAELLEEFNDIKFWISMQEVDDSERLMWVGAGTKDIGFGFERLTFKLSHKVDKDIDTEREYILSKLAESAVVSGIHQIEPGMPLNGHRISDGRIVVAEMS